MIKNIYLQSIFSIWKFQSFGRIDRANTGNSIFAIINITPMIIIICERLLLPWNSDKYDINTANGPQILEIVKRVVFYIESYFQVSKQVSVG